MLENNSNKNFGSANGGNKVKNKFMHPEVRYFNHCCKILKDAWKNIKLKLTYQIYCF